MRGQFWSTLFGGVVGGCVVLALQGGFAIAQPKLTPDTLTVRELNVVDGQGRVRLSLRCDTNDAPRIRLLDKNQQMRSVLGLGNQERHENPFLYMIDDTGVKADLSLAEDGSPTFFLNGRDGKPRLFMCAAPSEKGDISQFVVYGNSKGQRTEIISAEGKSGVSTYQHNAMRTYCGTMPENMSGMIVNDDAGRPATIDGVTAAGHRIITKLKTGQHIDLDDGGKKSTRAKVVK